MQQSAQPVTRNTKQGGFTLIELMIVVAIIGVLASIAVPQYQNYIGRSQAAEAFTATAGLRTDLGLYFSENGGFSGYRSGDEDTNYIIKTADDIEGTYIDSVSLTGPPSASGGFRVSFDEGVHNGRSLDIIPLVNGVVADASTRDGQISGWRCESAEIADTYLPSACRE